MPMPQGSAWETIKAEIAPPNKKIIKEHRDIFYRYISERYRILVRRQRGRKFPWTSDPILRDYSFTNVFRKDDKGTQWLLDHVRNGFGKKSLTKKDMIWQVVQYRWPNYPDLFDKYGWIPRGFNRDKWLKRINTFKEKGGKWHTSAHIVLQSNFKQTRAENYMHYLTLLDERFDEFADGIIKAKDMESAFKHVIKFQGFGGFTAYEILIDLCYLGVIPDGWRDEFANAGPGCQQGIDLIYPNRMGSSYLDCMRRLRSKQGSAFHRLGLKAPPRLTLQDIEFCLCELSKYIKAMHNTGRRRRYRHANG